MCIRDRWKHEVPSGDVLDLRAFPLTKAEAGRIELTIELPELSALTLDASAKTIEIVNGASTTTHRKVVRPITIDVPRQRELEGTPVVAARPHVDATKSFYGGFVPPPVPIITFGGRPRFELQSMGKGEIKREIKRHIARLGRCYEKAVEYKGGPDGEAVLHFMIDTDGHIGSLSIDGTITDPQITSCLAGVVAQFEFRAGDANTLVNYPLRFRLNQ